MEYQDYLKWLLNATQEFDASDLHIKVGGPPKMRVRGELLPIKVDALTPEVCEGLAKASMDDHVWEAFLRDKEADYAFSLPGVGRFRVNAYRSRGSVNMVLRKVVAETPTLDELNMPDAIKKMALQPRGLVLVTGPTGSGKTTTLSAMVDHINTNRSAHILTIEDPIEVMHQDKKSSVSQREVGTDTLDFQRALRGALRQDPDVILIGEMRDQETVRTALAAAETGHFVMSTLHTSNAAETITRIIEFFPADEHQQIRLALSAALQGVICQRLVPNVTDGRVAVLELAVATARLREAIADPNKTADITSIVEDGNFYGMKTFDQDLLRLVQDEVIAVQVARRFASNSTNFDLSLRRSGIDPEAS